MTAIETEAVFENNRTLRLIKPVSQHADVVRVILLMDESKPQHQDWPELFFEKNYGSCEESPLNIPTELVYETNRLTVE
jgi:hypothetical protein